MSQKGLDRIKFALEAFVRNRGMDMRVTRSAEQGDAVFDVAALEVAFIASILVPRLRDQVMARQFANVTLA